MTLQQRLYDLLEGGNRSEPAQRLVDGLLTLLIVANVVAIALESVPRIAAAYGPLLYWFETFSLLVFIAEYGCRLWASTLHLPLSRLSPLEARWRFALSPFMVIDLVAVVGGVLANFTGLDLRLLRIFRLLWLLKLARYSPALISLGNALYEERRALGAVLVIMFALLMFSASIMSLIERNVQPEQFGTIPAAMWWAMATLTTVGYGDVVPITPLGKAFGALVTMLGVAMYALPIAIVASGFLNQQTRRDFVITWGMVSRVPLFAQLDPVSVSKIAGILRARRYPAGYEIAHRGEPADCMYFVVSGELMVDTGERQVPLGEGDFVGEIALLRDTRRMGHIVTVTECRLMVLEKRDFNALLRTEPTLRREIEAVVAERTRSQGWDNGDIVAEELSDGVSGEAGPRSGDGD